ncbi:MAG: FkbM family methyltransferase [Dehalococcoidales bacterium]|nr:FkbM family methyltransferase [Dehalococcoidales bacterium]
MLKKYLRYIYRKAVRLLGGGRFGTIYPVRVVHSFMSKQLKPAFVEIDSNKIYLDPKDSLGLSFSRNYEPFETDLIKKEIKRGDVLLDIGANIGYYTLIFARSAGEEGRVFAFEPEPSNFSLLKKNVEANGYKNVELVQKAVSNETGKSRLFLSRGRSVDHRIFDPQDGRRQIDIEVTRLDDYFKDYSGKIDFIKIDVQGAEGAVIEGMPAILKNHPVKIAMEFNPYILRASGVDPEKCLQILTGYGFTFFEIQEHKKEAAMVSASELLLRYTYSKRNHTNLLCLKSH